MGCKTQPSAQPPVFVSILSEGVDAPSAPGSRTSHQAPAEPRIQNPWGQAVTAFSGQSATDGTANRAPVFSREPESINAETLALVSLPAAVSDPDGDEVTVSLSASPGDAHLPGELTCQQGRVFFKAKSNCDLENLDLLPPDPLDTVVTVMASVPHGATTELKLKLRPGPALRLAEQVEAQAPERDPEKLREKRALRPGEQHVPAPARPKPTSARSLQAPRLLKQRPNEPKLPNLRLAEELSRTPSLLERAPRPVHRLAQLRHVRARGIAPRGELEPGAFRRGAEQHQGVAHDGLPVELRVGKISDEP